MVNEDTSRTAKAGNDSMDPIMTMANESAPPQKVGIWEHIRQHIDPVSKLASTLSSLLLVAWSVFLFSGGLNFLAYYRSVGFIPELDLKASVTMLAVSAMTGTTALLMLGIALLGPVVAWKLMIERSPSLQGFWYDEDGRLEYPRAFLWLVLPIWVFLACLFIEQHVALYENLGIAPEYMQYRGFVSFLISTAITVGFLRRKYKQEWKAIRTFVFQFVVASALFCVAFVAVFLIMLTGAFLDTTATKALTDYAVVLFMIVGADALIATEWADNTGRRSRRTIALVVACLVIVLMIMRIEKAIPNQIMSQYKLGFLRDVSLILDDVGCAIVKGYEFQEKFKDLEGGRCRLSGVTIHSRLGTTYYVEVDSAPPSMRFTIPTQRVLSWAVPQPKKSSTAEVPQTPQNPASTAGTAQPKDNHPSNEN